MVKTSGIREKVRSSVLNELAKERSTKRHKSDTNEEDEREVESTRLDIQRRLSQNRDSNNSLLSILPRPKNASSFGPTIKLDSLLKISEMPDVSERLEDPVAQKNEDGMIEVDVSKEIVEKNYSIEVERPAPIVIPKGKEKQKNQITYLARLSKATDIEQQERAAQGRANKAAARSKYGW